MLNPDLYLDSNWSNSTANATREGFGQALVDFADNFPQLIVLTADLADSTRVKLFQTKYPNRFLDLGVAEQNLASVSAGLAAAGLLPVACSYAIFSPGRNWEQIRNSIGYSHLNVKIVSTHAGLSVGPDGATHQALEDIALTRVIPNFTIMSPMDYFQAYQATKAMLEYQGPVYLRLTRPTTSIISTAKTPFTLGTAQILRFGKSITIVATGPLVCEALKAADEIDAEVINVHTIKPLDINTILQSVKKTKKLITLEDHQIAGGLGSAVLEGLAGNPVSTKLMGVADSFGESGTPEELYIAHHLTWEDIIATAHSF